MQIDRVGRPASIGEGPTGRKVWHATCIARFIACMVHPLMPTYIDQCTSGLGFGKLSDSSQHWSRSAVQARNNKRSMQLATCRLCVEYSTCDGTLLLGFVIWPVCIEPTVDQKHQPTVLATAGTYLLCYYQVEHTSNDQCHACMITNGNWPKIHIVYLYTLHESGHTSKLAFLKSSYI